MQKCQLTIWLIINVYPFNKNYSKKIVENFKNWFMKKFKFFNYINELILLLRKGVYLYEFVDDWKNFNEK